MSDALDFGKHKDKPIPDVPLAYVLYLLANDHLRASRPASTRLLFVELLRRLQADFEGTLAEATARKAPEEWKALKAAKRSKQGIKLDALTVTRREEAKTRREMAQQGHQAAIEAERRAMAERVATGTDAAYFAMRARKVQNDVSDLV